VKRSDRRLWESATTLPELGELVARWLEGDIASQPGYMPNCGPDPETTDLVPVLARCNRAGFVTNGSQPGDPDGPGYDGATWGQRAAVEGFADEATAKWILAAAEVRDLIVFLRPPWTLRDILCYPRVYLWGERLDPGEPVTRCAGRIHTSFGRRIPVGDLTYGECSPQMRRVLRGSWQVTVVDPEWGRNDLLWETLDAALAAELAA
jgi:hypothetical protein